MQKRKSAMSASVAHLSNMNDASATDDDDDLIKLTGFGGASTNEDKSECFEMQEVH